MASAETKAAVKAARSAASASLARVRTQAGEKIDAARAAARRKDESTRGMVLVGIAGQHVAAGAIGQLHNKFGNTGATAPDKQKRTAVGAVAVIGTLGGAYLAATSNSRVMRGLGLAATGLGIGHAAIKSSQVDLIAKLKGESTTEPDGG